jgi:hypothetical protein
MAHGNPMPAQDRKFSVPTFSLIKIFPLIKTTTKKSGNAHCPDFYTHVGTENFLSLHFR